MLEPSLGSDFYYALRFSPGSPEPLIYLWRFFQTLNALHPPHLDETIAPVKLQWWQDEMQRTFLEKPEHPITRDLLPLIQKYHLSQNDFLTLLHAHHHALESTNFKDRDQLRHFSEQKMGTELRLYAQVLGYPTVIPTDFCLHLGTALFLIDKIHYFGQDLRHGKLIFPQSDLDYFQITPAQLFNKQCPSEKIASLLSQQAVRAKETYQKAIAVLPLHDRYSQCFLLIMAQLQLSLLDEIDRDHFNVLDHSYRLTPLRKCWIAWRIKRTERRRKNDENRIIHAN